MWEEVGRLGPCSAAGNCLTLRRTIPEKAGGPEAAVRNGGWSLKESQLPPLPTHVHRGIGKAPYLSPQRNFP